MVAKYIYLIGSLRNPKVPELAATLRAHGHEVFDDWYAAGPEADDYWMRYEQARGHNLAQALAGNAGQHVYQYDKKHLDRAGVGVLLLPAGKSGHLELGYLIGQGKPGYILLDGEPERFDVMYNFASGVFTRLDDLLSVLRGPVLPVMVPIPLVEFYPDSMSPFVERCHADRDGDCTSGRCPQLRDGEPKKSGRSCPLPDHDEE